eukprot:scaffold4799_cov115-Isochrysis_galbana.AAC.2
MVRKGKKKSASQDNPAEDTADSAAGQPGLGPAPAVTSDQQRGGDPQRAAGSGTGAGAAASPVPPPRAYVEHKAQPPPTAVQT